MTTWYIDPVNGSDDNSGDSWTVGASGTDGVTNGTTTFTSATGGFTGMAGRYVQIASYVYHIESVESDTSCTLDRTIISSGSNRVWVIGGAYKTSGVLTGWANNPFDAGGDTVKWAKTGGWDSIGSLTYTNKSALLGIGSGRVKVIDQCDTLWTGATDVTVARETSPSYKMHGDACLKMTFATAFTTGKMAYIDFGEGNEKDFSAFQAVSLAMTGYASKTLPAGCLELCLCSDANGDVIVDTVPLMPSSEGVYLSTRSILYGERSGGGNLGSSIRSVAFYAAVDPGALYIYIDNIVAVKAKGDANHLCHSCLIGQGNTIYDHMWGIQAFEDDSTIKLCDEWYGENAGAQASYRVEPAICYGAEYLSLVGNNNWSSPVLYDQYALNSGGWDPTTDIQDGVTCWRMVPGSSSYSYGVMAPSYPCWQVEHFIFTPGIRVWRNNGYVAIEKCGFAGELDSSTPEINFYSTSYSAGRVTPCVRLKDIWMTATCHYAISATNNGILANYRDLFMDWEWENVTILSAGEIEMGDVFRFRGKNIKVCNLHTNNYRNGCWAVIGRVLGDWEIRGLELKDNDATSDAAMYFPSSLGRLRIWNLTASGNKATFYPNHVEIICEGVTIDDTTIFDTGNLKELGKVALLKKNAPDEHVIYTSRGTIASEVAVRHTAEGIAWKFSPTHTEGLPIYHKLAQVALEAGVPVTIGVYMRRDNTGVNARLRVPGGQLVGMTQADYTDDLEAAANIWELVSVSFTPTETGVVDVCLEIWGGTTYSVYVDDLSVTV